MKPALTTGDVARYCHVTPTTVARWIKRGYLAAYTTPGGHHRVAPSEFRAFLERQEIPIDEAFFSEGGGERRVLIVDDEPRAVERIAQALTGEDGRFEIASTGDPFEAGMLMTSFEPQLVILDPMTMGDQGFQICRRIQRSSDVAGVKILVVSEFGDPEEAQRILALDAHAYVEKPLHVEELVETVARLMARE